MEYSELIQERIRTLLDFIKREKGFAYTTIGNLSSTILGALFWFILASILKVSEYGEVNYYIAFAVIPASIASLGLNTTVITYLAKGDEEVVREADSIILLSGLVVASALIPIQWTISIITVALVFYGMAIAEILGRKLYSEYAYTVILQRIIQIASSIILYFQIGIIGILLGYFLGPMLLSYRYLKNLRNITFNINSLRHKINFTLHSYGLNIIGSLATYLDKIIIGSLFGFYALGLYQLGFQFLMLLAIIPRSLYIYLLPKESSGVNKVDIKIFGLMLSILLALITFIIAPYIVKILFPSFQNAIELIRVMSVAVVPLTLTSLANAKLFGKEKSGYVFMGGLIYVISTLFTLIIFGTFFNTVGIGLAIILSQLIRALYLWSKVRIK